MGRGPVAAVRIRLGTISDVVSFEVVLAFGTTIVKHESVANAILHPLI